MLNEPNPLLGMDLPVSFSMRTPTLGPQARQIGLRTGAKGQAKGVYSWEARWPTLEQARAIVAARMRLKPEQLPMMSDEEILRAADVPRPELAGQIVKDGDVPDMKIKGATGRKENLITTVGLADVVLFLGFGLSSPTKFRYIAVGSDSTPVNTADTQLGTELTLNGWARAAATVSAQTTTLAGDTLRLIAAFTLTGTPGTVQEICIGNNASANTGDILTHSLTGAITLPAGPVVTFTYDVVWASA